jgi:hypothetical protein
MKVTVFVTSINKEGTVEASNGGLDGPPFVRFKLQSPDLQHCHINKRYHLTIEEAPE